MPHLSVEADGYLRWDTGDRTSHENYDDLVELRTELNSLGFELVDGECDHDTIYGQLRALSKTALLSFYTPDYQPLVDVTGSVKDAYCAKHGYRHIVKLAPYGDPTNYYAFQRLRYLRDLLFGDLPEGRNIEVVLVMNSHAQVMNHTIRIESLLDDRHDFYIAGVINGLNAGVFIVRKSEWLKTWLDHLLALEAIHHNHDWKEQKLIQDTWQWPQFKSHIQHVDQRLLQGYLWRHYDWPDTSPGQWQPGDWILHIPGKSTKVGVDKSLLESRVMIFSSPEITNNIIY